MLKINRLLRLRKSLIPTIRGGGWDRPDVPATPAHNAITQQVTIDYHLYWFYDGLSPEFFITQPQVYQGTMKEALPSLFRLWGWFLATAFGIGGWLYLATPLRDYHLQRSSSVIERKFNQVQQQMEKKQGYNYAKQNQFGIEVPLQHYVLRAQVNPSLALKKQSVDTFKKASSQVSSYVMKMKQQARKKVVAKRQGKEQDHGHGHH